MAGHFSTLLRGTVRDLLPHYEVYVTEWQDARFVPRAAGPFDLDVYIDYIIEFLRFFRRKRACDGGLPADRPGVRRGVADGGHGRPRRARSP